MPVAAKVLVVDDQEGIRKLLKEVLVELGYEAETVSSGAEAVQAFTEGSFKLVLMDMKMPGLNGFETAERLKKISEDLKIILMTGFYDSFLLEEAKNHGADGLLNKPFSLVEIQRILEETFKEERGHIC
ncbi:MAG: response regulator [Bacillota bacterium]|uniref:Stage 0 sporulation protein A homolog n=1 Tax=Thermanaerosceptrum fracticalcis TaxID=1712410 RepID=A0A7G6E4S3_THEFR|nr:response regulator [Thermanaerosceptrum fracticalcis]QNB47077.1 response regulator [Thermanaerosceptrum fracticalcis]